MPVQLRFDTGLAGDVYVTRELWRSATLTHCPLHPEGGCGFSRHGEYERKTPPGTYIARWYCSRGHCTISLLPDHLAARFPGTLAEIERVVDAVEARPASLQACADALRPDPVSLPSATRWLRRRLALVRPLLLLAVTLLALPAASALGVGALRQHLRLQTTQLSVLERLRALLQPHLPVLGAPVGFGQRPHLVVQLGALHLVGNCCATNWSMSEATYRTARPIFTNGRCTRPVLRQTARVVTGTRSRAETSSGVRRGWRGGGIGSMGRSRC